MLELFPTWLVYVAVALALGFIGYMCYKKIKFTMEQNEYGPKGKLKNLD